MSDSNVIKLAQPGAFTDSLTEILRNGARALLTQAVEAEVAEFLATHADLKTEMGQQRVVRHGHLPQREIMTGIGPVAVRQPRVRDREAAEGERIRYSPSIVPPYARRSKSLEVLIPVLYLKGISSGDFEEALAALVGKDARGLSASTIARLKEAWTEEHTRWQKRDLSAKRYVYCWVDGIHLEARLEEQAQCILVIIGATPEGRKELVGFTDKALWICRCAWTTLRRRPQLHRANISKHGFRNQKGSWGSAGGSIEATEYAWLGNARRLGNIRR